MRRLAAAFAAMALLAAAPSLARSALRMWTDKEGVVHIDDTPPPPQVSRLTGRTLTGPSTGKGTAATRSARPPPAARWWERRSDAPPDEIDKAAQANNIPAELVRAVIAVESDGDASARSHKGAIGLMQLMPGTAGQMYVEDPVDPAQNIAGGTRYLRHLANQFGGDMMLVLAAYNAGPEAVRKFKGVPPFEETRGYVRKVMAKYYDLKRESAKRGKQLASTAGETRTRPQASASAQGEPRP